MWLKFSTFQISLQEVYGNRVSSSMRLKFSDIITGGVREPRVPLHVMEVFRYYRRCMEPCVPLHEFDFVIDLQEPCVSLHMNDALSKKQFIDRRCMGTACPPPCKIKDNMYQYRGWWGTARPPQVGYISNLRTPQYFAARAWSMTRLHLMFIKYI